MYVDCVYIICMWTVCVCVIRSNIEGLQDKVSVVKTQMQHNLDSAMRRGDELDHLQTKAGKRAGLMTTLMTTPLLARLISTPCC